MMRVKEVMSKNPACCTANTSLQEVAQLMIDRDCGEIPVIEASKAGKGRPIGVVTDRDIVCRVVAAGKNPLAYVAETCMSELVVTVPASASLADVLSAMETHQVRRVPVVDERGCCIGMIAQADLAWTGEERDVAELVREVSRDTGSTAR